MKKITASIMFISLIFVISSFNLFAEDKAMKADEKSSQNVAGKTELLTQADFLLIQGGVDNIKKAMTIYQKTADQFPKSYESNWKCAKAHYLYAETLRQQGTPDWKDVCKNYGKKGFQYGEKAIALKPDKIEGNIYYGLCVWKYADGVSILTALKEGLKGSTQDALETSYGIEKQFDTGWPMKALGRFWYNLPWPLRDYDDSMMYFEEHYKYFPNDPQGNVFFAETLISLEDEQRAKELLQKAADNKTDQFYSNRAKELLEANF